MHPHASEERIPKNTHYSPSEPNFLEMVSIHQSVIYIEFCRKLAGPTSDKKKKLVKYLAEARMVWAGPSLTLRRNWWSEPDYFPTPIGSWKDYWSILKTQFVSSTCPPEVIFIHIYHYFNIIQPAHIRCFPNFNGVSRWFTVPSGFIEKWWILLCICWPDKLIDMDKQRRNSSLLGRVDEPLGVKSVNEYGLIIFFLKVHITWINIMSMIPFRFCVFWYIDRFTPCSPCPYEGILLKLAANPNWWRWPALAEGITPSCEVLPR